jgi:hypothetical protein
LGGGLLKGKPNKAPAFSTNIVTSDTILHKGTKYEVGDIVSVLDEGGRVYYALLRGFLEDQYAEKYAVLTWLIPTAPNPMTAAVTSSRAHRGAWPNVCWRR